MTPVLRAMLREPVRAAALGQWLGRCRVSLDCSAVTNEHPGIVVRCLSPARNAGQAEGWKVWNDWMASAHHAVVPSTEPSPKQL